MTQTTLRLLPLLAAALLLPAGNPPALAAASAAASAAVQSPNGQQAQAATTAKPSDAKTVKSTETKPAPQFDMDTLIERLKQTQAIGVLTKLVLRSDVTDLINEVKLYKKTKGSTRQLERIKAHFNGLLLKVLALLNDDPRLAQDIQSARDNLWQHLREVKA
jgi:hypothetical protein